MFQVHCVYAKKRPFLDHDNAVVPFDIPDPAYMARLLAIYITNNEPTNRARHRHLPEGIPDVYGKRICASFVYNTIKI